MRDQSHFPQGESHPPLFPPQKIALRKTQAELAIVWKNGQESLISGDDLRRFCACSSCRARQLLGTRLITESGEITTLALMGNAIQIVFADGHDRGIFPWPYLYAIACGHAKDYLNE